MSAQCRHTRSGQTEGGDGGSRHAGGSLPRWMRLYLYGMHGVTLDVLLSSLQGLLTSPDPKLLGYSSPYLCVVHSLTHFALERIYRQRSSFSARPVAFHLIFYPSVYICLQILIGNVKTLTEQVRVVSWTQLLTHYLLALYFSLVFHRALSRLEFQPLSRSTFFRGRPLPGPARFLFFGMHGLLDEVFFTSLFNLVEKSDRTLSGHTSLWSFFMYGSCSFLVERLYLHLHLGRGWGTLRRLPLYVGVIYAWELGWGLLLRQFDACSWDYSHYPYNFMGLITLLYLPGWVGLSLYQDVLSNVLLQIKCVGEAERRAEEVNGQSELKEKAL